MTKLVGVIVLCFSRTEVFVVCIPAVKSFPRQKILRLIFLTVCGAGLLLSNVSGIGVAWFLARPGILTGMFVYLPSLHMHMLFMSYDLHLALRRHSAIKSRCLSGQEMLSSKESN